MIFLGELRLEATVENLRTIAYFIRAIANRLELTEKCAFDIELSVDEAAMNIVMHAYPPHVSNGMVTVSAELTGEIVQITLTDWGLMFDPGSVRPFDIDAPIETRIQGGMGLHFIHTMMDSVTRVPPSSPDAPNALILTKRMECVEGGTRPSTTTQELNAVLNISEEMATSLDLDYLLTRIINELVSVIDADRGTLYLVDEEKGELFSFVLLEDAGQLQEIRVKLGEGIAGEVAITGKTLRLKDASQHPKFNKTFDNMSGYKTRTMLVTPFRDHHKKIIGVVQLLNKRGGPFTARDERLLMGMAAQAAISIENVRLYTQEIEQQLTNQELETARRIQKGFLPQHVPQSPNWDIATHWRPMREVAGDFYDFYEVPDGRLAVVIADVSGKGVPAALFMALSVTVMRFAMSLGLTPAEMMDRANKTILKGQQSKMFTTAFAGYLDLNSGVIQFASAGHNPPLLYHQNTNSFEYLEASGVAMGVFETARFVEGRVNIAKGDILVLYTDGITEIIDAEEDEFGEERLANVVRKNSSCTAKELVNLIMNAVAEFGKELGAFDDETLIVIKRQS
jgi:phosphoserine phosphatase RsbU/P